jgi:phosphoglucomutase
MHPRAGFPAQPSDLIDVDEVVAAYSRVVPDPNNPAHRVIFGTSGHRGRSLEGSFNEPHIAAITQAIVDSRKSAGIAGPVFVGADTHLLSAPALHTVLAVLAGNGVEALIDSAGRPTPTPAISHAIIAHNRRVKDDASQADGIIITPSHNPPADGGIKYNPPHGGPADETITGSVARRANDLLAAGEPPRYGPPRPGVFDFVASYVSDLDRVIDMAALSRLTTPVAIHPLGGAAVDYWEAIAAHWSIPLTIVDRVVDPQFGFMTLDHDGAIRMDPSSVHAMAVTDGVSEAGGLLIANDADADRHGIRCGLSGLMNPNHFLAAAIDYLLSHRPEWPSGAAVGKTMVSSAMIDRVVSHHQRTLVEVPVGFKWFVEGLMSSALCFGGEESAGAVFVARDGSPWVSEKDGIVMGLLAAEMVAVTGHDPAHHYAALEARHGKTFYRRTDFPATPSVTAFLRAVTPEDVSGHLIGGHPVTEALGEAPAGGPLGGIKLVTEYGWIAARPSGTEPIYKIYAESFVSSEHLDNLLSSAQEMVEQGGGK